MATIQIVGDGILTDSSMSSDGSSTITREIVYSGDAGTKITDIISSVLYPQRKSALPTDSRFYLDNISCQQDGDIPPTFKATARYKYSYGALDLDRQGNRITADTKPWLLPIADLASSYNEIEWPFVSGWLENPTTGELTPNSPIVNAANCRIVSTKVINVRSITFSFNMRHTGETPTWNTEPVLNLDDIRVAGIMIPALRGKLMPITAKLMTVYRNDGRSVKWEYWNCQVEIKIHPDVLYGWRRVMLNTGTLALWPVPGGTSTALGPIYKYTPWVTMVDATNANVVPTFGSLNSVVSAKNTYAALYGAVGSSEYNAAWQRLPWEEVTEQMPLTLSGTLDLQALAGTTPYKVKAWLDCDPIPWNVFNFPEWR